jgi:hypothetical protein
MKDPNTTDGYCTCDNAFVSPSRTCGIKAHRDQADEALGRLLNEVKQFEDEEATTPLNDDHTVIRYLHCKRAQEESVFSASQQAPFCPHCGQRLITNDSMPERGPRGDIHPDDVNLDGTLK